MNGIFFDAFGNKIERDLHSFENELLDFSKPYVIIVSPDPIRISPFSRLITLFDISGRYLPNYGVDPHFDIDMPLLNYNYGAFLENIANSPIQVGKIRFESIGRYKNRFFTATLPDFGEFSLVNYGNVGDGETTGIDLTIALNQIYTQAVDYYLDLNLNGQNSLQFFMPPNNVGALKLTCWFQKTASVEKRLYGGNIYQSYKIPSIDLPVITKIDTEPKPKEQERKYIVE